MLSNFTNKKENNIFSFVSILKKGGKLICLVIE